ncbi:MAG: hypothetical protein CMJ64_16550 [Planctomycetaceae bacterium]|nr:hypothetical protein [Planctomycetaceae bacterium]
MARMATFLRSAHAIRIITVVGLLFAAVAVACETPVYRYAMYRWQPAPYEVYFFHDAEPDDKHQQVAELLEGFGRGSATPANVAYLPVNVAEDKELASVPPDVKKAWDAREDKSLPTYFISTPYGAGLKFDQLDPATVKALVESPARKSLAAQLETGKLGVFVMLTGKEAAETKQTEEIMTDLVEEVRSGKVSLYLSPTEASATESSETEAGEGEKAEEPKGNTELGFMKVDRESAEEKWFVRSLLAMEPDLEQEERPMVFLVYGRARALLPYIGKGITRENLLREIEFVSGACSCTVKEQNPGVDLLVRYDWESAAAALADKFGNEEGNESQFGPEMFFPELIIGEGATPEVTDVAARDVEQTDGQDVIVEQTSLEEPAVDPKDVATTADHQTPIVSEEQGSHVPPEDSTEAVSVPPVEIPLGSSPTTTAAAPSAFSSVWVVGGGVAVALLVLFGLTFVVLRPQ